MSLTLTATEYNSGIRLITPIASTNPSLFNFLKNADTALTNLG